MLELATLWYLNRWGRLQGIQTKTVFIYCSHFSYFLFTKWELQRHVLQLLAWRWCQFSLTAVTFQREFSNMRNGNVNWLEQNLWKMTNDVRIQGNWSEVDNRAGRLDCITQWGQNAFWGRISICILIKSGNLKKRQK